MSAPNERIVSFEEACRIVQEQAEKLGELRRETETLSLVQCAPRILAQEVRADRDQPPFPRSARDGFAVRSDDVKQTPRKLRVVAEIAAGAHDLPAISEGEAVAIMTGAPVPPGADAVVMVEHTHPGQNEVEILRPAQSGENIVPRAAEAKSGAVLLMPGDRLDAAAVALAASAGKAELGVFRRPRVAILATGSELVEIGAEPGPHQIRNSNSYSIAAQVEAAGAEAVLLPIARDENAHIDELVRRGLKHDLLILSGGVSVGKYDLVEPVLENYHAELFFTGALIQPGKPVVFGSAQAGAQSKFFFGLPGNPVSTVVTFQLFVAPFLAALCGAAFPAMTFAQARLKEEVRTKPGLTRFLPALLSGECDKLEAERVPWHGSGDLVALARSNCYLITTPKQSVLEAGAMVSVLLRD